MPRPSQRLSKSTQPSRISSETHFWGVLISLHQRIWGKGAVLADLAYFGFSLFAALMRMISVIKAPRPLQRLSRRTQPSPHSCKRCLGQLMSLYVVFYTERAFFLHFWSASMDEFVRGAVEITGMANPRCVHFTSLLTPCIRRN